MRMSRVRAENSVNGVSVIFNFICGELPTQPPLPLGQLAGSRRRRSGNQGRERIGRMGTLRENEDSSVNGDDLDSSVSSRPSCTFPSERHRVTRVSELSQWLCRRGARASVSGPASPEFVTNRSAGAEPSRLSKRTVGRSFAVWLRVAGCRLLFSASLVPLWRLSSLPPAQYGQKQPRLSAELQC